MHMCKSREREREREPKGGGCREVGGIRGFTALFRRAFADLMTWIEWPRLPNVVLENHRSTEGTGRAFFTYNSLLM